MYSVPVRCDGHGGIGELRGVLRFDGQTLSLQYQTADPILHEFRSAPVELPLPAAIIVEAQFRAGFLWLRPAIELRLSDVQALARLPTREAGRLQLRLGLSDRRDARKIVDGVNAICADFRLARLDASLDAMTSNMPGRSRAAGNPAQPRGDDQQLQ
jgi:hypothetical protein